MYIVFCIDTSGVSLISKYLRYLGSAVNCAESFITGHE
mgnify:CR=1 FL=1